MYKDKPLIVQKRPWWRHHVFPWGWYSLRNMRFLEGDTFDVDGYYRPDDGSGGKFACKAMSDGGSYCGTTFFLPKDGGVIGFLRQHDGRDRAEWFGAKE